MYWKSAGKALFVLCLCSFWMSSPMEIRVAGAAPPVIVQIDNPSPEQNASFGRIVEGLSDIDGDGIPDLAVGAIGSDRVYLLSGDDQSVIHSIEDPDGVAGFWFGFAIREIGDIDGDGVQDVAVGAPAVYGTLPVPCAPGDTDPECEARFGRVFVFSGESGEVLLRISNLRFHLGASVAPLGDIDNDGIPDFAVGAPYLYQDSSGEVYAIAGADGSILWSTLEPAGQAFASLGAYMSEIEDLNGDGCSELLVGAPFSGDSSDFLPGKAYILSGADGSIWYILESPEPVNHGFFGGQPSAIGDQDGDGIEDVAIGEAAVGRLHLFRGADGDFIRSIEDPQGASADFFGFSIAKVDDKDGDGLNDFWVAASKDGRVHLMNGMGDALLQIDDPDPIGLGQEGAFGWSISATGDLDGDDNLDLIIGKSVKTVEEASRAGAAFLVLGVSPNHPPTANAGPDQTLEQESHRGTEVTLDGSQSTDPDSIPDTNDDIVSFEWYEGETLLGSGETITSTFPLGTHTVTLVVTDSNGETDEDEMIVTVQDTTPPAVSISIDNESLWPPNHKMVDVGLGFEVSDICDPYPVVTLEVTSDEPTATAHGAGGSKHAPDADITDEGGVLVRAERSSQGDGRVYVITVTATDASGLSASSSAFVMVNHNKKKEAIDSGQHYDATEIN